MSDFPLATQPSTLTPGYYVAVNLLGGQPSPANGAPRALIMATKSSAGTITANTQLKQAVSGADEVRTLLGPGTPGHLCAVQLFKAHPLAKVDVISPTVSGGSSATATVTFGSAPTSNMTIRFWIKGVQFDMPWNVGTSVTDAGEAFELLVDGLTNKLPCDSNNSSGTVTLTAKFAGPWGNDITLYSQILEGAGGTVTLSGAAFTGGTTEPSFATALTNSAAVVDYDFIIPCVSNADAQTAAGTCNPGLIEAHLDSYDSGLSAHLTQQICGLTGALASAITGANGRNHGPTQFPFCLNGQSFGCEFAGWEAGRRMLREEVDPACNRIGDHEAVDELVGAFDLGADRPTDAEIEQALGNGLSIFNYDAQGDIYLVAPITTYSQDASGNTDRRLFYVSGVSGPYAFTKAMRRILPVEYEGAKISDDLGADDEPPPNGVVQIREVRATIVEIGRDYVRRGVLDRAKFEAVVTSGDLVVRVNPDNTSQVDIVVPVDIVPPLSKFSAYTLRRS
jgi:phage tail sheath gpL-like